MALGNQINPMQNMMQAFQQFSQDPAKYLRQMGIQVPDGMTNPTQILNWAQESGAVTPQQMQQVQQAQQSAAQSPIFNRYFGQR